MALWASMGHAMRRRMGAPSAHHESAGTSMSRNQMTPEEVLASAEHASSPRKFMGFDATKFTNASATPGNTTPVAKKNTQAADPTAGGKANRKNVSAGMAAQADRLGARYTISATFPAPMSPEAGATMRNARVVPSVVGRQAPNFGDAMRENY